MTTHVRTTNSTLEIRAASITDTCMIVDVHLQSFPTFFLSFLGRRFLTLLYEQMCRDNEGVVLVAASSDGIEGFVAGVSQQVGFYRRLIERKKWAFALAALAAVIRQPAIAPRLIRALKRPAESQKAAAEACLMSIAVRPEAAGQGIGQQLVKAFCQELSRRAVPAVCLTTDHDHNERVNEFYQRMGFQLHQVLTTPEGRTMNEYVMPLPMKEHHA